MGDAGQPGAPGGVGADVPPRPSPSVPPLDNWRQTNAFEAEIVVDRSMGDIYTTAVKNATLAPRQNPFTRIF